VLRIFTPEKQRSITLPPFSIIYVFSKGAVFNNCKLFHSASSKVS